MISLCIRLMSYKILLTTISISTVDSLMNQYTLNMDPVLDGDMATFMNMNPV